MHRMPLKIRCNRVTLTKTSRLLHWCLSVRVMGRTWRWLSLVASLKVCAQNSTEHASAHQLPWGRCAALSSPAWLHDSHKAQPNVPLAVLFCGNVPMEVSLMWTEKGLQYPCNLWSYSLVYEAICFSGHSLNFPPSNGHYNSPAVKL